MRRGIRLPCARGELYVSKASPLGESCTGRKASRGVFPEGKHPEPQVTDEG